MIKPVKRHLEMLENIADSVCLEQFHQSMWRLLACKRIKSDKHIRSVHLDENDFPSPLFLERAAEHHSEASQKKPAWTVGRASAQASLMQEPCPPTALMAENHQ